MVERSKVLTAPQVIRILLGTLVIGNADPNAISAASADKWRGGWNIFVGQKAPGKDWDPVEYQDSVGFGFATGLTRWPVAIAFDYLHSNEESSDGGVGVKGKAQSMSAGVRKVWESGIRRT